MTGRWLFVVIGKDSVVNSAFHYELFENE
jgi:hypothetical protein